jgi:hypothetical protein
VRKRTSRLLRRSLVPRRGRLLEQQRNIAEQNPLTVGAERADLITKSPTASKGLTVAFTSVNFAGWNQKRQRRP